MKMTEFLEKYQDKADAAIAVGCAVLLLASAGLLVNQFRLQKQLNRQTATWSTPITEKMQCVSRLHSLWRPPQTR